MFCLTSFSRFLIQASIGMAAAILVGSVFEFSGLGIAPPTPSWGSMLNDARNHLFDAPHMVIFPSIALVMTVLSFNFWVMLFGIGWTREESLGR